MKKILALFLCLSTLRWASAAQSGSVDLAQTPTSKETQQAMTSSLALDRLMSGNTRFQSGQSTNRYPLAAVKATASGQFPFAAVLGCIDSRVPPEIIFDQGLGDLFSVRVAGNIVDDDVVGSLEFATKSAGAKLILVLGHTHCGAVKGACQEVRLGRLTGLLDKIRPAIQEASAHQPRREHSDPSFLEDVAVKNVSHSVQEILSRSSVIRSMVDKGDIAIRGAIYDVETGAVRLL